jgi:DNA polymerase bacteriophage-type
MAKYLVPRRFYLDFETCSDLDLKKVGVDVYAYNHNTHIIAAAWAFDDEPVQSWNWQDSKPLHETLPLAELEDLMASNGEIITHNATFERTIWNAFIRNPTLDAHDMTQDTMIRGAYWGFPMALEQLAEAMGLPFGKDLEGRRIMLQLTKPRDIAPDGTCTWWHETDREKLRRLTKYCEQDVELERVIDKLLPELPPDECHHLIVDADMNDHGLLIDIDRVEKFKKAATFHTSNLDAAMNAVTGGKVKNTRALSDLKKFLHNDCGLNIPDLSKDDIDEYLSAPGIDENPLAKKVLELRQEAAKTSVAKLDAMLACASKGDQRVRNMFQFYGANRTGRYAGRLIQPQNFPRPHAKPDGKPIKRTELEDEIEAHFTKKSHPPLKLISSALRSTIIAAPGHSLVVVDFSQIEARVLAWVAGQQDILDVFASGQDVYTYAAKKIGSKDRQLGKVMTLGLGYGMGPDRFIETAAAPPYKLLLDATEAQDIVYAWRRANNHIEALWYSLDRYIRQVIEGIVFKPNKWHCFNTHLRVGKFLDKKLDQWTLIIELPSGRHLVYRDPQVDKDGISYLGTNQYTRKWERIRSYGAKFVENIVQAIARDLMIWVMKVNPWGLAGTVHDEGIWEVPDEEADALLKDIEEYIVLGPPWAAGLPMKGEGFVTKRYGK